MLRVLVCQPLESELQHWSWLWAGETGKVQIPVGQEIVLKGDWLVSFQHLEAGHCGHPGPPGHHCGGMVRPRVPHRQCHRHMPLTRHSWCPHACRQQPQQPTCIRDPSPTSSWQ